MGRQSPGKWIRNLLLGKKSSSKSNSSKNNYILKPSGNKDVLISSEASMSDPTADSLLISPPLSGANATQGVLLAKEEVSGSSNDVRIISTGDEEANAKPFVNFVSKEDLEKIRLTEAAIKAQAAFRGYQARQTFQTLKGVIRLQALIRGHLVRRQAVSALYCVKGIIKFQALARGYKVRRSVIGLAVQKIRKDTKCSDSIGVVTSTQAEKLSASVFVHKLLASSPSAVPQYLNYDLEKLNLAWEWLDRWTRSRFWALLPGFKKLDSVSDEKNGSCQTVETNEGQVKRNAWTAPAVTVDVGSISDSNEYKRLAKKDSNHPLRLAQEHPQKEIEKSSFKKSRMQNVSYRSEVVINGKRKQFTRKVSDHTVTNVSEQEPSASSEKMKDLAVSKSKQSDHEKSLARQAENEYDNESHNDPIAVLQTSMINGKDAKVSEDLNGGDNCINDVNPKNFLRRASLPANFNDQYNEFHNTQRLPSYMAPTESTKAKLRGQGSPRFAGDFVDKNSIMRRYSLSSSLNSKSDSFSPRAERLVAMSGKGVIRNDRSLSSLRGGTDKLIQPQWRR